MNRWSVITVVENRNAVTRICVGCADKAALAHRALYEQQRSRGWLSVSIALAEEQPHRSEEEMSRARALLDLITLH